MLRGFYEKTPLFFSPEKSLLRLLYFCSICNSFRSTFNTPMTRRAFSDFNFKKNYCLEILLKIKKSGLILYSRREESDTSKALLSVIKASPSQNSHSKLRLSLENITVLLLHSVQPHIHFHSPANNTIS